MCYVIALHIQHMACGLGGLVQQLHPLSSWQVIMWCPRADRIICGSCAAVPVLLFPQASMIGRLLQLHMLLVLPSSGSMLVRATSSR